MRGMTFGQSGGGGMTRTLLKDSLSAQIDKLPYDLQLRVLDFVKTLSPKGVEGKSLLRFEGAIPADDLRLISKAIEESCEQVDANEW
jgi:hypothetical protein